MTILTDMAANVYVLTNRPDLVAETTSQLKKAAIKLHGSDFFKYDLVETIVPVTLNANFRYTVDLTNVTYFSRFRKLHYIREYNTTPTGKEVEFKVYDAADILDDYNLERTDYAYQAGLACNVKASKALTQLKIGYFCLPNIGDTTFSSWIANMNSAYIEEEAARSIFKIIGKDEEFQKFEAICADNLAAIKMAGI